MDAVVLVASNSFPWHQFRTYAQSRRSSQDLAGGVLLIDSAGGNQRHLR
jgi:hypothetical protein